MPVNVDEIISTVIPEPGESSGGAAAGQEPGWKTAAQWRALQARMVYDHARTAAEGFDD